MNKVKLFFNLIQFFIDFIDFIIKNIEVPTLVSECPSCGEALHVTRLECCQCNTNVDGSFPLPALLQLEPAELDFITSFVRMSGSLKKMAEAYEQSYPTIRNRLNQLIEKLETPQLVVEEQRKAVLDALAKGDLSVEEAALKLEEIGS